MPGSIRNIFVEFQLKADKLVAELKNVDKAADKSKLKIDNITESLKKHKGALLGVAAATGLVARSMIKGAAAEEIYRLNIKSLTSDTIEGQKELESYYNLIDNVPDFVSKEQRAGLISQLKLFGLGKNEILKLTPEIERLGIATGRTVDDVSNAFSSALAGQFRSLQTMGIRIRESDIQDFIKENRDEMQGMTEDQQRFAALTAVFLPQAADKIGEFGDVEKAAFVQTQKLNAAISDLSGDVGATLLPAVIIITKSIGGFIRILDKIPFGPTILGLITVSALMLSLAGLAIPPLIAGLGFLGVSFVGNTVAVTGFAASMMGLATAVWAVLAPLLPFIAAGALVALIIQDFIVGLKGGESAIFKFADLLISIPNKLKGFGSVFKDAGKFLIDTFIEGMTFGLLNTDRLTKVFSGIRDYLPFSDAKVGPLSDLTLSGKKFMQTFAAGAESQTGLIGGVLSTPNIKGGANGTLGAPTVTIHISDVKLSGDDSSLQKFGEVTVAAVEKAMGKIIQKQATAGGY